METEIKFKVPISFEICTPVPFSDDTMVETVICHKLVLPSNVWLFVDIDGTVMVKMHNAD